MKEIKVRIKLPSKQELNKQLDDLTKNGVDLNFNEGNLKKSINNANAQLNKLKETRKREGRLKEQPGRQQRSGVFCEPVFLG